MELQDRIQNIHLGCFKLCHEALGQYLPVAGNIGIFCQSDIEFDKYSKIRKEITHSSPNPNQKYFELKTPIIIEQIGDTPTATYKYLYVRRPNPDSPEAGDIDFILPEKEYFALKERLLSGISIKGASIYERPGWDTIEIRDSDINALAYIGTQKMAEKVRIKF